MLLKFLGWFWVLSGILFLFNPEFLRHRLKKKSVRKIRRLFFALAVGLGLLLINATLGVPGLLAKILLVMGFIAILKGLFFLKAQAAEGIITWCLEQPIGFYRYWACGLIIFGAVILSV